MTWSFMTLNVRVVSSASRCRGPERPLCFRTRVRDSEYITHSTVGQKRATRDALRPHETPRTRRRVSGPTTDPGAPLAPRRVRRASARAARLCPATQYRNPKAEDLW